MYEADDVDANGDDEKCENEEEEDAALNDCCQPVVLDSSQLPVEPLNFIHETLQPLLFLDFVASALYCSA